jgi:CHAT domain-containing protein
MGPIPSDEDHKQYFSDLYISSYTPSISALTDAHDSHPNATVPPPLLLIGQPDAIAPGVKKEVELIEGLGVQVTSLVSEGATHAAVMDGLRHHQFVHFACQGTLVPSKPFDASLKLQGEECLTLLDIVRSQFPTAQFAFLSASHTAELTEESSPNEMLHLAAAMQRSGFRSVVGTMWSITDTDRPDVARHFYESMFSNEWDQVPYYKRSAKALRDAVQRLRRKSGVNLGAWVNFVHYGA